MDGTQETDARNKSRFSFTELSEGWTQTAQSANWTYALNETNEHNSSHILFYCENPFNIV